MACVLIRTGRERSCLCFLALAMVMLGWHSQLAYSIEAADVVRQYYEAVELLGSYSLEGGVAAISAFDSSVLEGAQVRVREVFEFGKHRIDTSVVLDGMPSDTIALFNGQTMLEYNQSNKFAGVDARSAWTGTFCALNCFFGFSPSHSYRQFIENHMDESLSLTRDGDLITLHISPEPQRRLDFNTTGMRLTFSPQESMMPVKIVVTKLTKGKEVEWNRYENELSEILPGIWFPMRSTRTLCEINHGSSQLGEPIGQEVFEIVPGSLNINVPVDKSEFAIDLAPGTRVHDMVKKSHYTVGAGSTDADLDQLAAVGRLGMERLQEQNPRLAKAVNVDELHRNWRFLYAGMGLAVLGALLVGIVIWRRKLSA